MKQESEVSAELKTHLEKIKQTLERQVQLSKDSIPDLSQLKNSYEVNFNEIVKELEMDPSMKQISQNM